jgi:predicted enzyme related to lactoylglutathione lyase
MDAGRMVVVKDPTGAVFMLWQARRSPGVGVKGEPGSLAWNELATHDRDAAEAFYTALFGWSAQTMDMGAGMLYTTFTLGDGAWAGGMYGIAPDHPPMPSNWMPYFAVEDADASAARAKELGGTVVMEPQDIPNVGRFAMITDPQGAMFYVIRMNPM